MIDIKATDRINKAVLDEFRKITKEHGMEYHTTHEGYGVLLEEVQECKEEAARIEKQLENLWTMIRNDKVNFMWNQIENVKQAALSCAEEAVQVAAVCVKFQDTIGAIEIFGETI